MKEYMLFIMTESNYVESGYCYDGEEKRWNFIVLSDKKVLERFLRVLKKINITLNSNAPVSHYEYFPDCCDRYSMTIAAWLVTVQDGMVDYSGIQELSLWAVQEGAPLPPLDNSASVEKFEKDLEAFCKTVRKWRKEEIAYKQVQNA